MPNRFRPIQRTGVVLLGVWLLALLLVTSYTIKLIWDEELIKAELLNRNRTNTFTALLEQVNLELRNILKNSVSLLENQRIEQLNLDKLDILFNTYSSLQRILFLNDQLKLVNTFPVIECDDIDMLILERIRVEQMSKHLDNLGMHLFVESAPTDNLLLALIQINNVNSISKWLVLVFNINELSKQQFLPLMDDFCCREGGKVIFLGPDEEWHEISIHMPINHIIPGYTLIFQPNLMTNSDSSYSILPLTLSLAILLALGLAGWSAFREVRRSHAIAELRQRFLAHISHELKTPLALVRMYAETLHLGRINDPEKIQEYYRVILREAERLSEMIQNVLTFARFGQLKAVYHLRHNDLAKTVIDVLEEIRPNCESYGLTLNIKIDPNLSPLLHDREGIMRILWNLLDNAAKYAGSGEIEIKLYSINNWIRLEVLDRGPGITEAERPRLLRPFERGWENDNKTGSGLGLALIVQVAEVHEAIFSLEDRPGGGLCARVAFPINLDN